MIVCEGEKTERYYLDGLKREETISKVFAITVVPGKGGSRSQIIERAINQKAQRKGMDVVLCVLDTESLETIQAKADLAAARQEAARNDIALYLSNPAFEVWFLAHFIRTSRFFRDCDAVIVELDRKWNDAFGQPYDKSDDRMYQRLATHTQDAVNNAKMVVEIDHREKSDITDRNSSTDFYQLEHFQGIPMRLRGFPSRRCPAPGFHVQPEEWPHGLTHTAVTQHSVKML